jgi:transcription elongation GreA/GreB family factor
VDTETLKQRLLTACRGHVESRIHILKQSMELAQQAANEEGKSSAGDKYETGRAMMQIERDQAARQLDEALKLRSTLDQISAHSNTETVALGSLVITSTKKIFISIGIGKLALDDEDFLVVGPASPLGKALMGLKQNDKVVFNNETLVIEEVC